MKLDLSDQEERDIRYGFRDQNPWLLKKGRLHSFAENPTLRKLKNLYKILKKRKINGAITRLVENIIEKEEDSR